MLWFYVLCSLELVAELRLAVCEFTLSFLEESENAISAVDGKAIGTYFSGVLNEGFDTAAGSVHCELQLFEVGV